MEEVGRKLYLSETPSIGWEAKTLGAKRRISSGRRHKESAPNVRRDLPLCQRLYGYSQSDETCFYLHEQSLETLMAALALFSLANRLLERIG